MKRLINVLLLSLLISLCPAAISAENKNAEDYTVLQQTKVPQSVLNIAKENTYPNPDQDLPYLQPSSLAKQLTSAAKVKIENPELIHMLNESAIAKAPLAFGYRATIYLGHWALSYQSAETSPNWDYQKINTNYFDNRGNTDIYKIHYVQETQKTVRGGLTAKIPSTEDVQKMMLLKAIEKTGLPLSFETVIGAGTKKDQVYNIPPSRLGYLNAYASAVNEKGKVTYGEVYLVLKGSKKHLMVKNITSQGIGAWIPVHDHLSFSFTAAVQPK
ncbi:YfkD family protein [Peribacillus sp. B-H-3]|uniref:YfkD famly protein n=1 Tax=Peribacillus sp. B-H-3 TaxID=3400420 RepID=UPI003B0138DA